MKALLSLHRGFLGCTRTFVSAFIWSFWGKTGQCVSSICCGQL